MGSWVGYQKLDRVFAVPTDFGGAEPFTARAPSPTRACPIHYSWITKYYLVLHYLQLMNLRLYLTTKGTLQE